MSGEFAAMEPSHLKLLVNGQEAFFTVPRTGNWETSTLVEIGSIRFDNPGVYHLKIFGANTAYHPVNLWQILCER